MIWIGVEAPGDDARRLEADELGVASLAERLAALVQRLRASAHLDAAHQSRLRLHIVHDESDEPVAPNIAQLLAAPHSEPTDVDRVEVGVIAVRDRDDVRFTGGVHRRQPPEALTLQVRDFRRGKYAHAASMRRRYRSG